MGSTEVEVRIRQRSKRIIQFTNNKIIVKPARNQWIRWEKVAKFQFERVPETSGMTKLRLFLTGHANKRTSGRPFWTTVLENSSQVQALVNYLQTKKVEGHTEFAIQILEQPTIPQKTIPFPLLGWSLCWGGLFLLLNGGPILLALLNYSDHKSGEHSNLTPHASAKLGRFIAQPFSRKDEFRHFFLTLSIGLVIAGVLLQIWGWWLTHRKTQVELGQESV